MTTELKALLAELCANTLPKIRDSDTKFIDRKLFHSHFDTHNDKLFVFVIIIEMSNELHVI